MAVKKRVDWNSIKAEFMAGASYGALASAYGLSKSTIHKKAQNEEWAKSREKTKAAVEAATIKKTADAAASNAALLERARGIVIAKLICVLEAWPENGGTKIKKTVESKKGSETVEYALMDIVNILDRLARAEGPDSAGGEILNSIMDVLTQRRDEHD